MKNNIVVYNTYLGETKFPNNADVTLLAKDRAIWIPQRKINWKQKIFSFFNK